MADDKSTVQKVAVQKLVWASGDAAYNKYHNESQKDTFGGYLQEVNLVFPAVKAGKDGKETPERIICIQKGGKPTSAIPTHQRLFLKLMAALMETSGDKKGSFFADSFALNAKNQQEWVGKLAEGGAALDWVYGNPDGKTAERRFASIKSLMNVAGGLTAIRQSTVARYPSAVKVDNTVTEAAEEAVELVL